MPNCKPKTTKRGSARIAKLTLLFGSLATSLLLCEFFIRAFFPQRLYFNVSQWDPYVGFSPIPNIEGYSRHHDYTSHVKINSRGLRDRDFAYVPPPRTLRIGVFGDSFTFGEGVRDDETYPKILERLLNNDDAIRETKWRVEVLNFGIGKTATSHQLAWYQKEGRKYHLDLVILGFLSLNDFGGNWGGVFHLEDDQLIHDPAAYSSIRRIQGIVYKIPCYRWLAEHSHLVNLSRRAATRFDDKMRTKASHDRHEARNKETRVIPHFISDDSFDLTVRLIREFQRETLEDDSRFMVVNLPAKNQRPTSADSEQDRIKPYVIKCEMLLKDLEQQRINVLNLVPIFADLPVSKCYFEHDTHMNALGHEVVASNIYEAILLDRLGIARQLGDNAPLSNVDF